MDFTNPIVSVSQVTSGAINGLWTLGNLNAAHVEIGTHPNDGSPTAGYSGIRAYDTDGQTLLFNVDAATGALTAVGGLATNLPGQPRVEIESGLVASSSEDRILLYTADPSETAPGSIYAYVNGSGTSRQGVLFFNAPTLGGTTGPQILFFSQSPDAVRPSELDIDVGNSAIRVIDKGGVYLAANGNNSVVWNGVRLTVPGPVQAQQYPVIAQQQSAQDIPNGAWTVINLVAVNDPSLTFNGGTSAYAAPVTGYYAVTGGVSYEVLPAATDIVYVAFAVNGARVPGRHHEYGNTTDGNELTLAHLVHLNSGDSLQLHTLQNTGGPLSTRVAGTPVEVASFLEAVLVSV